MLRIVALSLLLASTASAPLQVDYRIEAIRYATIPDFPVAGLVVGADPDDRLDIAMVIWMIRGEGRTILFDAGFEGDDWIERFGVTDFISPQDAVRLAGVDPEDVTDVIVSHAHWDHMGGIELFPGATIWIQREEFHYYTGTA